VIVTDSVPVPPHKRLPLVTTLSIAELVAGAIIRIHEDRSVSELS